MGYTETDRQTDRTKEEGRERGGVMDEPDKQADSKRPTDRQAGSKRQTSRQEETGKQAETNR